MTRVTTPTHCANCGAEVAADEPHQVGQCNPPPTTLTLATFLEQRIDEDERDARVAMGHGDGRWASWNHRAHTNGLRDLACGGDRLAELPTDIDEHIARHDPARVLAECAAKRAIVALGDDEAADSPPYWSAIEDAMRLLALPYVDHPDYQEAWRP